MIAIRTLRRRSRPGALRFVLRSALTVALLIGTGATATGQERSGANRIKAEFIRGNAARSVELGEAAVARAPRDALLRAKLGHAYLRAGRFESAVIALSEAVALGDSSDRTTLVLALAQIACGQTRSALATLDRGATIAPADLGLALALAGDTGRGVAILTDGVRDGSASAVLRQNLAYADALDGRWADARLTASLDLPPEQVETRLQQWAQSMQSGGERLRIARLLGVPVITDPGMPEALALNQTTAAPVPIALQPVALTSAPGPAATAGVAAATAPVIAAVPMVSTPPTAAWQEPPTSALAAHGHGKAINSGHFVQLGAYLSLRSAERGKFVLVRRLAQLRGHGLSITRTTVAGQGYWRVVMASLDGGAASSMCASLKRHGAACFAYSVKSGRREPALALANTQRPSALTDRRR